MHPDYRKGGYVAVGEEPNPQKVGVVDEDGYVRSLSGKWNFVIRGEAPYSERDGQLAGSMLNDTATTLQGALLFRLEKEKKGA